MADGYCAGRAQQRNRVRRDGLAAADGVHALVGLALDAHARDVEADRPGNRRPHRVDVAADFRRFENHRHVHVADLESLLRHERYRPPQQIDARRVLPLRIRVGKVTSDVAEAGAAENRVGDRMADDIRVRVAQRPTVGGNGHAAQHQRSSGHQPMEVVAGAGAPGPCGQRHCGLRIADCGFLQSPIIPQSAIRNPQCLGDRLRGRQIAGDGDLDVRRIALDEAYGVPGALDQCRLVGCVERLARGGGERLRQYATPECLRRLREEDRVARERFAHGPARACRGG